jgi:hypothetical protein
METENNKRSSNFNMILSFIIGLLLASFAWYYFTKSSKETVVVPAVTGSFKSVKPIHTKVDTVYLPKFVKSKIDNSENEFLQGEINRLLKEYDEMDLAFANANDSLQQLLYRNAISINEFQTDFDNDTLTASVKGLVRGEVQTLGLKYTIKERSMPKPKETVFRLLSGAEFGMTQTFDNINAKGSIIGQFKSGNQISVGIDTQQRFYIGGAFSIFNIKK